jgi:hypothetical protein
MPVHATLSRLAIVLLSAIGSTQASSCLFAADGGAAPKVDFSYAFATPHRITIGRPDASDRTLLDCMPSYLQMSWSYDNLAMSNYPLLAFKLPITHWRCQITPHIDGRAFPKSRWTRYEAVLPALENVYEDPQGTIKLEALGGMTAGLIRIEAANTDSQPHQFRVHCGSYNSWGENPAWVDSTQATGDNLVAGFNDRADRVLVMGIGADAYSLQPDGKAAKYNDMVLVWNLKPGQRRSGWIVRPYRAFADDLPKLRRHDWAKEWEQGKKEWRDLLSRALKFSIPDAGVTNAYLACVSDLFIMREPMLGGYIGCVVGTEQYRAGSSIDPAFATVALDVGGYHKEAADGYRVSLDMQKSDGNWADYQGWSNTMWCCSGFKCHTIMEHYRLTRDTKFLAEVYPRMVASSRFQERQRARMRPGGGARPPTYGLMPRGMGDGGLWNDGDLYGVFYTHNIWAVYGDKCSLAAADILGKTEDIPELKKIYETARDDLLVALDRGAITETVTTHPTLPSKEKDYRWIPGVAGKTSGSRWGVLQAAFPTGLLPPDHELITGTLRRVESNISQGGLALGLGWMGNGVWMAMSLDNVAETHLARGNGDAAVKYLYAVLNHGTPFYTWCEERGQEPGSADYSGDYQHEWTPTAVVRLLRDIMVMESGDGLNLALGTERHWLASGKLVGIAAAPTHFGPVSYQMQYDAVKSQVSGEAVFAADATAAWSVLHIRLPGGLKVKSVNAESKATVLPNGSGIRWTAPRGTLKFQATVGN